MYDENLEEKIQELGILCNLDEFQRQTAVNGDMPYITELGKVISFKSYGKQLHLCM